MSARARGPMRALVGVAGLALVASLSSAAGAHIGHPDVRAERYLKLDLAGTPRLVYTLALGRVAATAERKRADRDSDGRVDEPEAAAAASALGAAIAREVSICAGETLASASCRSLSAEATSLASASGWGGEGAGTLVLEWETRLALSRGDAVVRVDDRYRPGWIDRTDVAIVGPTDGPLVHAGPVGTSALTTEMSWIDSALGEKPISFFAERKPRRAPTAGLVALFVAGASAGGLFALWRVVASRRARRS